MKLLARYYIIDYLCKNLRNSEILNIRPTNDTNCRRLNLSQSWVKLKANANPTECDEIKALCNMIVNVSKILINDLLVIQGDKATCKISAADIMSAFRQEYARRNKPQNRFNLIYLKTFKCIDFIDLEFEIMSDSKIKDVNKNELYIIDWANFLENNFAKLINVERRSYFSRSNFATQKPGHWLASYEIEYLAKLKKKKDPELANIQIFCLERDISQLFDKDSGEEELINVRKNFQDKKYAGTAVFVIYTGQHWISCVVTKNADGATNFIFADSLGRDCLNYSSAKTLIQLLTSLPSQNTKNKTPEKNRANASEFSRLPLDVLFDENNNNENIELAQVKMFIEHLRQRDNFDQTIFIYGPPKTGKSALANTIAVLSFLPGFIRCKAINLIVDHAMFNNSKDNDVERIERIEGRHQPIDMVLDMCSKLKTVNNEDVIPGISEFPPVLYIHLLDKLLLGANSKESKKLLINFLLKKLEHFQRKHKILFIISSHLPYDKYPKGINFADLPGPIIKFDMPDYNKRINIITFYINNAKAKILEATKDKVDSNGNKTTHAALRSYDISNLATMTNDFSCEDIKEFIKLASEAKIKGIVYNLMSDASINWQSRDLKNRFFSSTFGNYNLVYYYVRKANNWISDYDRDYVANLYGCYSIRAKEIQERKKLEGQSESWASQIKQRYKDSENAQFAKECFDYVSETKIGQAFTEGIAEEVKDRTRKCTKNVFDGVGENAGKFKDFGLNLGKKALNKGLGTIFK